MPKNWGGMSPAQVVSRYFPTPTCLSSQCGKCHLHVFSCCRGRPAVTCKSNGKQHILFPGPAACRTEDMPSPAPTKGGLGMKTGTCTSSSATTSAKVVSSGLGLARLSVSCRRTCSSFAVGAACVSYICQLRRHMVAHGRVLLSYPSITPARLRVSEIICHAGMGLGPGCWM